MCFRKNAEKPVSSDEEKDIALKENDMDEVSGGIKWGNGDRPTLNDAITNKERMRKK